MHTEQARAVRRGIDKTMNVSPCHYGRLKFAPEKGEDHSEGENATMATAVG